MYGHAKVGVRGGNEMRFMSLRVLSSVFSRVLFVTVVWLITLATPNISMTQAQGFSFEDKRPDCSKIIHTLKKYGRFGVLTTDHRDAVLNELGKPDLPQEHDKGYKLCWRCFNRCPQGKQQNVAAGCIFMDFDWRVRGYGFPECEPLNPYPLGNYRSMTLFGEETLDSTGHLTTRIGTRTLDSIQSYREEAEKGNPHAQFGLGLSYYTGKGSKGIIRRR
jgi:hypothetical protein